MSRKSLFRSDASFSATRLSRSKPLSRRSMTGWVKRWSPSTPMSLSPPPDRPACQPGPLPERGSGLFLPACTPHGHPDRPPENRPTIAVSPRHACASNGPLFLHCRDGQKQAGRLAFVRILGLFQSLHLWPPALQSKCRAIGGAGGQPIEAAGRRRKTVIKVMLSDMHL